MAAPVDIITRGTAVIYGLGGEITATGVTGIAETGKANHKVKLDSIEDENGSDACLIATNEMVEADFVFVPISDIAFVTPLSTVTTSGFAMEELNADWIYVGDASIDMSHKAAKYTLKCRRYINNANIT